MKRPGRLRTKNPNLAPPGLPTSQPRRTRPDVLELKNAAPEVVMARCRSPRYWPVWAFDFWLRGTAALPWRTAIKLHEALGRIAGALSGRRRRIVRRNLELCFPELAS